MGIEKGKRRSIRLPGFDYSQAGMYFVTICTDGRRCLLGEIVDGQMFPNNWGTIVQEEWLRAAIIRSNVSLDFFVIMPNHLHGIIELSEKNVGATRRVAPTPGKRPQGPQSGSLSAIIGQFKSITTKRIKGLDPYVGVSVWQRNYYEHVIRHEEELNKIRDYIVHNPLKWPTDRENPSVVKTHPRDEMEIILSG